MRQNCVMESGRVVHNSPRISDHKLKQIWSCSCQQKAVQLFTCMGLKMFLCGILQVILSWLKYQYYSFQKVSGCRFIQFPANQDMEVLLIALLAIVEGLPGFGTLSLISLCSYTVRFSDDSGKTSQQFLRRSTTSVTSYTRSLPYLSRHHTVVTAQCTARFFVICIFLQVGISSRVLRFVLVKFYAESRTETSTESSIIQIS